MVAAERDNVCPKLREFNWRTDQVAVLSFQYEIYGCNFPGCVVDEDFIYQYNKTLREAARNTDERLVVLDLNGEIIGFMWLSLIATLIDDCVGYIKNIYVAPEFRGHGYGVYLLQVADEWFRSRGASKATLDATASNDRAVRLYEMNGYGVTRYRMEKHYERADKNDANGWNCD